jgi:ubiquinone/menaquinone biosynthesis C-methylase UbiE
MNCDPIARWYRWIEYVTFGRTLERCRFACLPRAAPVRKALLLGDGDGRFLNRLLQAHPEAEIWSVDASAAMLRLARGRSSHSQQVRLLHDDALTVPLPSQAFDLVVTQFFLDCFDQRTLPGLVDRISGWAAPGATWVYADFQVPSNGIRRWRAKAWVAVLYFAFQVLTGLRVKSLSDPRPLMQAQGFQCVERKTFSRELLSAEEWTRSGD